MTEQTTLPTKPNVPFVDEVEIFNSTFGKPNNYGPVIPEQKITDFVVDFIKEETEELSEAIEERDIVSVLDAICDLLYVAVGNATMAFGLKDKLLPAYEEVQASNMSKVCLSVEEAEETGAEYLVTLCPTCELNLKNASEKNGNHIKVKNVLDLVYDALV